MKCIRVRRPALTLIELLVVIGVIGILMAILIPAVQMSREAMRRSQCANQVRQIGLALQNYHASFNHFPMHGGGTADARGTRILPDRQSNLHRLSYAVAILPMIEQQALWERISNPLTNAAGTTFPPMGPVPWFNITPDAVSFGIYPPWDSAVPHFRCPTEGTADGESGHINYAACFGDGIKELGCALGRPQYRSPGDLAPVYFDDATKRGMFANWHHFAFADCTDGTSQTLLLGEIATLGVGSEVRSHAVMRIPEIIDQPLICRETVDPLLPAFYLSSLDHELRGSRWSDAALTISCFNTVFPPNSPSCTQIPASGAHANWFGGIFSTASLHPGGANVCFVDGSVRFITDQVDATIKGTDPSSVYTGNITHPPGSKSPYGVWGALGTRAQHETISGDF